MLGVDVKGDVLLGMSLDQLSIPIDKKSKPDRGLLLKGVISLLLISGVYFMLYNIFPGVSTWICVITLFMLLVFGTRELLRGVIQ